MEVKLAGVEKGRGTKTCRSAWAIVMVLTLSATAGCQATRGRQFARWLDNVASPDPNVRYASYEALGRLGDAAPAATRFEAVRLLASRLTNGGEPAASRAALCRALGQLGVEPPGSSSPEVRSPVARKAILKALDDPSPLVREQACRALGRVGQPEDAIRLAQIMNVDRIGECRLAAIEALGVLRIRDPRVLSLLVEGMEHEDPAIRLASVQSLRSIAGQDLGLNAADWKRWLEAGGPNGHNEAGGTGSSASMLAGSQTTPPRSSLDPAVRPTHSAAGAATTNESPPASLPPLP